MNIFSSLKLSLQSKYESLSTVPNKIRVGDIFAGRVLKVKDSGLTLFNFNQTKTWLHVTFPVKEGEIIEVAVAETHPRIKLRLVDQKPTAPPHADKVIPLSTFPVENTIDKLQSEIRKVIDPEGRMLTSKPLPRRITTALQQLFSHFQHLDMGKTVSHVSSRLRSYIENSGIFFEKKLANEIQSLHLSHPGISTGELHQNSKIRSIIKSDLKPYLLILKHFVNELDLSSQKGSTENLRNIKPLINQMLENIGFQQTKPFEMHHGQKVTPEAVYADPRTAHHVDMRNTGDTASALVKLAPTLHRFMEIAGRNMDEKIHHSILKVLDASEIASSMKNAPSPIIDEATRPDLLKEGMVQHLKRLEEFFKHRAASADPFDLKELEDIKKALSHVRTEIETRGLAKGAEQKGQKTETGQVITFALPLPGETGEGKLKIFYSKKRKNGIDEGFKMSLLLQMAHIGAVRTDFFLLKKQLKIDFYLSDHKIEDIIHAHADSIENALGEHFSPVLINIFVSERKVEDFEIEHLLTENTSLIDLRV